MEVKVGNINYVVKKDKLNDVDCQFVFDLGFIDPIKFSTISIDYIDNATEEQKHQYLKLLFENLQLDKKFSEMMEIYAMRSIANQLK